MTSGRWSVLAAYGACRDTTTPEIFFPPPGGTHIEVRAAKQICATCPVRVECLEYAFDYIRVSGQPVPGIWGGTTERERRDLGRDRTQRLVDAWIADEGDAA